ncbi:hypothetical protein ANN_02733, partial [Periplaneta americana]
FTCVQARGSSGGAMAVSEPSTSKKLTFLVEWDEEFFCCKKDDESVKCKFVVIVGEVNCWTTYGALSGDVASSKYKCKGSGHTLYGANMPTSESIPTGNFMSLLLVVLFAGSKKMI